MNNLGTISVSKKAVTQIIRYIAENCGMVSEVTEKNKNLKKILFGKNETDGINITRTNNGIAAEIHVIFKYGADMNETKKEIEEKIKAKLHETGIKTDTVRVVAENIQ